MKKRISVFVVSLLIVFQPLMISYAAEMTVSAQSAVLMCFNTGEVLYSKDAHKQLSMASTTKIMTSLLALESGTPEREITVTKQMVTVDGTSMGLLPGDSVSLRELVYGMMLPSGNDAANTVAHILGGSQEGFARMMNDRARLIGMKNTNFVTASGLDSGEHYSTAYDMALLAAECLVNPEFVSICSARKATLTYGNPPYRRTLSNHNRLLWSFDGAIGMKTGFTKKSGRCLVSAAERDGVTLIAVTLNAPDDWNDHIRMLEYGFSVTETEEFSFDLTGVSVPVFGGNKKTVCVEMHSLPTLVKRSKVYSSVLLLSPYVYAPVSKGDSVGTLLVRYEDETVARIDLIAACDVEYKQSEPQQEEQKGYFEALFQKIKDYFVQR